MLCVVIVTSFWSTSRYPDLIEEWDRSKSDTLLDRNVGAISKSEMMATTSRQSAQERIYKTAANWIETNARGMTFGVIFGSGLLVLLGQTNWIREQRQRSKASSLLGGVLMGAPLGVCTNCAAPIGLSMYRSGVRLETVLAMMVASPALNPIGLVIVFSVFPLSMALLKLASVIILVLIGIPLLIRLTGNQQCPLPLNVKSTLLDASDLAEESWQDAAREIGKVFLGQLWYVVKWTIPFMFVVALLGALLLNYYPLEQLLFFDGAGVLAIIAAAVIGAILPAPMFVDIIIVLSMLSFGLSSGPATALLITLGPVSLYASVIIWRHMSGTIAVAMLLAAAAVGVMGGYAQSYYTQHSEVTQGPVFQIAATHNHSEEERIDFPRFIQNFVHSGASWGDFDGDGYDDLWVSSAAGGHLYRNDGDGNFIEVTRDAGILQLPQTTGAIWGDYDNDGDQDLLILYYGFMKKLKWYGHSNILWRNNGNSTFTDVTKRAGLLSFTHTTAAAWGDYDADGYLDLYVSNYGVMTAEVVASQEIDFQLVRSQVNQLYRNNGDGTFTDVAEQAGVAGKETTTASDGDAMRTGHEMAVAEPCYCSFQPLWFDYDKDGHLDLFVANDFGTSQLYRNEGSGYFEDVTLAAGLNKYSTGMGLAVIDINHDGYLDLYETTIEDNPLWINQGDGTFSRTRLSRLLDDRERYGWGVAFLDYDNDTHEDLMIANGLTVTGDLHQIEEFRFSNRNLNSFYRNLGNGNYVNVVQELGLVNSLVSRGLAVSDYNQDGYPDVYVTNKVGENVLYRNTAGSNNWLAVKLQGTTSNRDGIGATITVFTAGVPHTRLVTAGSSYSSQHSRWFNFGIGAATAVDKIVIHWPSGTTQRLADISVNQRLLIVETGNANSPLAIH